MVTMHLLKRGVMAIFCTGLIVSTCAAEELSLTQAIEQVLRNNPTIAADRLSADAAKQSAKGAGKLTNPDLEVAPSIIGDAGADSAVLFIQPLELNGSRKVRGEIAANEANAAGFEATASVRDILLQTRQAYWETARAQESVKLYQANLEYVETLHATVQKQLDIGTVPGAQLIKADVELAGARQELEVAVLGLSQAKAQLNALMNRPQNADFTITEPLAFSEPILDRQKLMNTALDARPELAAANARSQAARGEIKAAKLRQIPDLAIQARTSSFDSDAESGVALAVSLPILDWGSIKAEKKRAEIAAASRTKQFEAEANAVKLEVDQAINEVCAASNIVKQYQTGIVEKSEQLADMARKGYEKGATNYLEVLEAQRTLRGVKNAYYTALADHAKALAQLAWATGSDLQNCVNTEVIK